MRASIWTQPDRSWGGPSLPPAEPASGGIRTRRLPARLRRLPWPLLAILAGQAAASVTLMRANTAFIDEALYLWAGHLEIANWLSGKSIPAFPAYFSGAPVLYPPLGALADTIGGLVGARMLSLGFILLATSLLWATISRLYGRRSAFFGCALFAVLGPTMRLGAFATYDAMSLCLLALATWCAVHAAEKPKASKWLVGAALALALANATAYSSAILDPVVLGLLILTGLRALTRRQVVAHTATVLGSAVGILAALFLLGGGEYWTGFTQTTIARVSGPASASAVFSEAWHLTAVVVILAGAGALLSFTDALALPDRLVICVAAATALLVPLEQAHVHTLTSLDKHVAFGAWFAAIAGGYAVDRVIRWVPRWTLRWGATAACVIALVVPAQMGMSDARTLFRSWSNSTDLVATAARLLPHTKGPILAATPAILEYYLPEGEQWERWSSTSGIRLPSGHSISVQVGRHLAPAVPAKMIRGGFFSVVILPFSGSSGSLEGTITAALEQNHHYHLVAETQYGRRQAVFWEYEPQSRQLSSEVATGPQRAALPPLQSLLTPVARPRAILGPISVAIGIAGGATLAFTVATRYAWRRRKESYEA